MIFIEGKWLYNNILAQEDIFKYNTKEKIVQKLSKDREIENVELKYIPAQMKQGVHDKIKSRSMKCLWSPEPLLFGRMLLVFTSKSKLGL